MQVIKTVRASFYVHWANCFFPLLFLRMGMGWGGSFAGIDKDIEAGCKCEMNKQGGSLLQGPK